MENIDQTLNRTHGGNHRNREMDEENALHTFIVNLTRIWNQFKVASDQILKETGAYNILDKLARKSAKHPYLALGISIGCVAIAFPFLIILVFALSTVVMTFTGFIFLEGTLITVASILLFGCLGAVLIITLFFGIITLTGYFGFLHIYDLFSGIHSKKALNNFLNREKSKSN